MASNILKNATIKLRLLSAPRAAVSAAKPPYHHYYSSKAPLDPHGSHEVDQYHEKGWHVKDKERMYIFVNMPGYDRENFDIVTKENRIMLVGKDHEQPELSFGAVVELPTYCTYDFSELSVVMREGLLGMAVPKTRV